MNDEEIIRLINLGLSANEICLKLGLSNKQLYYRLSLLKINGYDLRRKYYSDGEITYYLKKDNDEYHDNVSILTSPKDTQFKAIVISDLHISSVLERIDLINDVYDYCIKENINIIINAGDLVDGTFGKRRKKYYNSFEQIDYLTKIYPFDKNILNFVCLGDHDYSLKKVYGQDIKIALENRRHDIIPLGYGTGILEVKNDEIIVRHKCNDINCDVSFNKKLILVGHCHQAKTIIGAGDVEIFVPSLSNILLSENNQLAPSMIKMTLSFINGYFKTGVFEHLLLKDKIYKASESQYELCQFKNTNVDYIKNEEKRKKLTL